MNISCYVLIKILRTTSPPRWSGFRTYICSEQAWSTCFGPWIVIINGIKNYPKDDPNWFHLMSQAILSYPSKHWPIDLPASNDPPTKQTSLAILVKTTEHAETLASSIMYSIQSASLFKPPVGLQNPLLDAGWADCPCNGVKAAILRTSSLVVKLGYVYEDDVGRFAWMTLMLSVARLMEENHGRLFYKAINSTILSFRYEYRIHSPWISSRSSKLSLFIRPLTADHDFPP